MCLKTSRPEQKLNLIPCCNLTTLYEISLAAGFLCFLLSPTGKLEATLLIVTTITTTLTEKDKNFVLTLNLDEPAAGVNTQHFWLS